MKNRHRYGRWMWPCAGLLVAGVLAVIVPDVGLTRGRATPLWTESAPAPLSPSADDAMAWVEIASDTKPAVVNISSTRERRGPVMEPFGPGDPMYPFFERFFGGPERFFGMRSRPVRSLGSGFIINPDGYIVTNSHVVEDASEITVRLSDGREFSARLVGRDPKTDIALLKVDATGLPAVPLGDSSTLQVGEPVMAIGNPFGLEQTVTTGIISATGRVIGEGPYDDFIQVDASINPGNSGGPLINLRGEAIGINTAILTRGGGSIGIGFAIPVDLAKPVLTALAETGRVERGWLGITIQRITPQLARAFGLSEANGALVTSVVDGSPARKAGLEPGDVIVEYDGQTLTGFGELPRLVAMSPAGESVQLVVVREGERKTLTAEVARLDELEAVARTGADGGSWLGFHAQTLTPALARELGVKAQRGVIVRSVEDGSPAAKAGIRPGDVIAEVNRNTVTSVDEMTRVLQKRPAGTPVLLLVRRDGGSFYVAVTS